MVGIYGGQGGSRTWLWLWVFYEKLLYLIGRNVVVVGGGGDEW